MQVNVLTVNRKPLYSLPACGRQTSVDVPYIAYYTHPQDVKLIVII